MAQEKGKAEASRWKAELAEDPDLLRVLVQEVVQQVLEAEMDEALQAGKGERTESRLGYRCGSYSRTLITRVGRLELRVPQDRQGRFSTRVFERYQRSEKALVLALAQMYVQGVSTRKVKAITEEPCGHSFSASAVSEITRCLDEQLEQFASRSLSSEEYPYLILDARYERVREGGVIGSRAVQVAIGINWEGRRCILAVELAWGASGTEEGPGRQVDRSRAREPAPPQLFEIGVLGSGLAANWSRSAGPRPAGCPHVRLSFLPCSTSSLLPAPRGFPSMRVSIQKRGTA